MGLAFNENYIDKILVTSDSSIDFDKNNAQYTGLNINEGIKNFKFDFDKGIISFIDDNNIQWIRVN